ncbi:GRB2-associated-binding protein 1-like isoform X2 [Amphibalanus amphitrite]|uniref:GRB2-associated-binding protein 1-like isoform X2 n=1 Tax=Amphibalanus amphitrite TaxID=1232801 RepID=UPI001C902DB7|nr:GRB2-associated-binding protein 1-like isoform X2 [Amphibalanus amphitrite]
MHLEASPPDTGPPPLRLANGMDDGEVVHEGWLIKSPPQKRFPRAWRKRFFLLRRSGSLPSQYVLEYFSDESKRKLKGKIELDQCEQVDAGLTLDSRKHQYDFMFDIRTPKRTFYLAAESRALMERWVDCICRVCGLKVYPRDGDEHGPALVASATPDASPRPASEPLSDADDSDSPPGSPSSVSASGPYIPISECISGVPRLAGSPPSPAAPTPAKAAVSARPFSSRRRPVVRRGTDVADLETLRAGDGPAPAGATASPPPQVNWETFPGPTLHSRSNSMPETVKGGVNKAEQLKQGPPRPPKPRHLQGHEPAGGPNYQNCEELRSPRLSDTESATPRTPTTVPADDMFDFRRAQQERASGRQRGAHPSAAPGQIFNYDFPVRSAPVVNRTLKPRKVHKGTPTCIGNSPVLGRRNEATLQKLPQSSESAAGGEPAPAAGTPCSTPGSAPPAVYRALKPSRQPPAALNKEHVLTLAPPPLRHGAAARHQRAAPSPTPLRAGAEPVSAAPSPPHTAVTAVSAEQVYCDSEPDGRPLHEVQYLDLDLADAAAAAPAPPRSPAKTPLGREASTGTVYKTVDFVKTEAFNKTRQSVELERTTKDGSGPLSRSSADVSRRSDA